MPISTNENVVKAMMNQRAAQAGRLTTNGVSLYSYNLEIARWIGAELIVFDYTATGNAYRSQTTSQHVGIIKRAVPKNNVMLVEFAEKTGLIK
jgi:hypothetical protein|tara:strand:+ start:149 stop:427 length:279 start_codon:yes stop_codon:yes gene_type:complete